MCSYNLLLKIVSNTLTLIILEDELMLEDLSSGKSRIRVKWTHFFKKIFKCTTGLVLRINLPKPVLFLSSKTFVVRVLLYCTSEWWKLETHYKKRDSSRKNVWLNSIVSTNSTLIFIHHTLLHFFLSQFTFFLVYYPKFRGIISFRTHVEISFDYWIVLWIYSVLFIGTTIQL